MYLRVSINLREMGKTKLSRHREYGNHKTERQIGKNKDMMRLIISGTTVFHVEETIGPTIGRNILMQKKSMIQVYGIHLMKEMDL